VLDELGSHLVSHGIQVNPEALSTGQFHRRNEVGVSGDQDDRIHEMLQREQRDVESNPKVDALLLDTRCEVLRGQRARAPGEIAQGFLPQPPSPKDGIPLADGEVGGDPQRVVQALIERPVRAVEQVRLAAKRIGTTSGDGWAVIEVSAQQPTAVESGLSPDPTDKLHDILGRRVDGFERGAGGRGLGSLPPGIAREELSLHESTVEEDGETLRFLSQKKMPPIHAGLAPSWIVA
jgi:hypothetical protein